MSDHKIRMERKKWSKPDARFLLLESDHQIFFFIWARQDRRGETIKISFLTNKKSFLTACCQFFLSPMPKLTVKESGRIPSNFISSFWGGVGAPLKRQQQNYLQSGSENPSPYFVWSENQFSRRREEKNTLVPRVQKYNLGFVWDALPSRF